MKKIICDGIEYRSLSELASAKNVKVHSLYDWVRSKADVPIDIHIRKLQNGGKIIGDGVIFRGIWYANIRALGRAYGAQVQTLHYRLKRGYGLASALGLYDCVLVEYYGKEFASCREIDRHYSLPEGAVNQCIHNNKSLSIAECIDLARMLNVGARRVEVDGMRYTNMQAACEDYGVQYCNAKSGHYWQRWPNWSDRLKGIVRIQRKCLMHSKIADRKRRELQERIATTETQKRVLGAFTAVKQCVCCNKYYAFSTSAAYAYANAKTRPKTGFCSDVCKQQKAIEDRRNHRRKRRSLGRDCRGKIKPRLAKLGRDKENYDIGITAQRVAQRDKHRCQICGTKVQPHKGQGWQPSGWTVGHIIALANGGKHTWQNVQCECSKCNTEKGTNDVGQLGLKLNVG